MRYFVVLISLVAGWSPVAASESEAAAEDLSVACYWLAHAQTGRDVAYAPGEDVYGRAVVPADLTPPSIDLPDYFEFNILVDMADDLPGGSLPLEAQQQVAHIRINPTTGVMWIDGVRYLGQGNMDLERRCAAAEAD